VVDIQAQLRGVFARWGLPEYIRVDNGAPWGSWSDLPPPLALWWLGLGIQPLWNHPHCPKENAFVERCNGLIDTWGEPNQCPDLATWQKRMEWMAQTQREVYPSVQGKTRLQAYPALGVCLRAYSFPEEARQWQLARAEAFLSQGRFVRLVGQKGQISLYNRAYGVGTQHAGSQVFVRYDPQTHQWVIQRFDGQEVIRHATKEITAERIRALEVSYVKPSRRQGGA
jgi:hypothetical protein